MEQAEIARRRAYGRGFNDGFRAASVAGDKAMTTAAKILRQEQSLNGIARKVLEAIGTTGTSIDAVVRRLHDSGSHPEYRVVQGCIVALMEQGLVRETGDGYVRITARPTRVVRAVPTDEQKESPGVTSDTAPQPEPDTLGQLAELASRMRQLSATANEIAKSVEDVALSVEQRIAQINTDTEKLRQLKALLGSL